MLPTRKTSATNSPEILAITFVEFLYGRYKLSVYRIGDLPPPEPEAEAIPHDDMDKFFVTADCGSAFENAVHEIPLAGSVEEAHALAVKHLSLKLEGECMHCKTMQPWDALLDAKGCCIDCLDELLSKTLDAMYEVANEGWHD
jgi:hypothetical protein